MGRPYGDDLRRKYLHAYDQGEGTHESLADRFCVSVAWAKKISAQRNRTGQAERVPYHPGRKPAVGIEMHPQIKLWFVAQPDLTLAEVQQKLHAEAGISLSLPQIWHLLNKLKLRLKKSLHAAERDTEVNRKRREEFVTRIATIAPNRLVFLDESGVTTSMTRLFARSEGGGRIYEAMPDSRWKILTIIGAMSLRGMIATMTIEEATDGDIFRAYVDQVLCAALRPGDVVVMDNLSSHKVSGVREMIEKAGAEVLYLPPYSPDLNPIEKAWSKLKKILRDAKARTKEALEKAIAEALKLITADNALAWFNHCIDGL
jgi:transposase